MRRPKPPALGKIAPDHELDATLSFSFAWLTTQKKYLFERFGRKQARDELDARHAFDELVRLLSKSTWKAVFAKRKEELGGTEQIPYSELNFRAEAKLPKDTDILSFRFGSGSYRALGIKMPNDDRLYIVGFDFDFSAYKHE